jgi:hypothetical protein
MYRLRVVLAYSYLSLFLKIERGLGDVRSRRRIPKMLPALITQLTAAGCAFEEPDLDQIRFNHILNRLALFRQSGSKRLDTGWTTLVVVDECLEETAVRAIEAKCINFQKTQGRVKRRRIDLTLIVHLGIISHSFDKSICDTWSEPGASSQHPK